MNALIRTLNRVPGGSYFCVFKKVAHEQKEREGLLPEEASCWREKFLPPDRNWEVKTQNSVLLSLRINMLSKKLVFLQEITARVLGSHSVREMESAGKIIASVVCNLFLFYNLCLLLHGFSTLALISPCHCRLKESSEEVQIIIAMEVKTMFDSKPWLKKIGRMPSPPSPSSLWQNTKRCVLSKAAFPILLGLRRMLFFDLFPWIFYVSARENYSYSQSQMLTWQSS